MAALNVKIEKDIPVPPRRVVTKYPWRQMEVGDSFELKGEKAWIKLNSSAATFGKKNNLRFIVRKTDAGARVWRIE